jgi:hypothetical protein
VDSDNAQRLALQEFEDGFVQVVVARNGFSAALAALATREVARSPTSFFYDQKPRGDIPRVEFEFPIAVQAARRDIAEVEGCASISANGSGGFYESREVTEVVFDRAMDVIREAGREHCVIESGFRAYL